MGKIGPGEAAQLADALLAFYDREGRPLPWRGERDLYRIWVSEIMLQQTGVATVLCYYPRFLARFPTLQSLAEASEEAVLLLWQGLGYYQRARHLHRGAQHLLRQRDGQLPERIEEWLLLPGVGPSTAAAILAIGRNQPHAILDGNVKRVLARLVALPDPLSSGVAQKALWALARSLTPDHRPGDYAQAIMDLGATLCRRSQPFCDRCPWQGSCQAHRLGAVGRYPVVTPRPVKPHRQQVALLVFNAQRQLLFCQRPARGLLANLWEPPTLEWGSEVSLPPEPSVVARQLFDRLHVRTSLPLPLAEVKHTFTHFQLTIYPFVCQLATEWEGGGGEGYQAMRWVAREAWQLLPLATLHRKVLATLF